jgi:hypothetical protein
MQRYEVTGDVGLGTYGSVARAIKKATGEVVCGDPSITHLVAAVSPFASHTLGRD